MFGLTQFVVLAERDLRDKTVKTYEESCPEAQVWLWRHKVAFFVSGALMLALLIVSGNGV